MNNQSTEILYLSHGGGPMPLLGDTDHREMVVHLQDLAGRLLKPSAILLISAHWEEPLPTITSNPTPSLVYDYYGFPPESYEIQYPCPGEPRLAQQVYEVLEKAGITARLDAERGLDHGAFVPLKLMYPAADIPCIQLSLSNDLSAKTHLAIGRALRALQYDGLLVIGSGFSFHNMRAFFTPGVPGIDAKNQAFEDWLLETCASPALAESERSDRLADWEKAPHARFCHPREEHLLPLHICYGMAGKICDEHIPVKILGKQSSIFRWSITPLSD